ncbi:MAG: serine hydrolase domain-containing protein [Amphiplicatus sp.]
MIMIDRRRLLWNGSAAAAFAALPAAAKIVVEPAGAAGFTAEGVAALNREMHALVDEERLAGVITVLARKGRVVNFDAYGYRDAGAKTPLGRDAIWNIASMTKPITGVAMMQLCEEGRWKLDDPVAKHIPQFAGLKVKTAEGGLVDQRAPMTMLQLMSHTAGFDKETMSRPGIDGSDLQGMVDQIAETPLASQPGTDFAYGPAVNIQGYVVEKLSGLDLADYMQKRIFDPLKMPDTQFWVDPSKAGRVSRVHTYDDAGKIVPVAPPSALAAQKPRFLRGSGGLYSTAEDYYRFCQALANGGALEGARILKPETVKLMRVNVLAPGVGVDVFGPVQNGVGFGLDFAVHLRPDESGMPLGLDSYWWGGALGTWFWIDPTNDVVFVGMIANLAGSRPGGQTPPMREIWPRLVYGALAEKA